MAKKLYEESNIQDIANAIREKNNSTDKYKVSEMADAISALSTGDIILPIPEEALGNTIRGNHYRFYGDTWDWFIETYGEQMKMLYAGNYMFAESAYLKAIPFTIRFATYNCDHAFYNCQQLKEITKVYVDNGSPSDGGLNMSYLFANCYNLRTLPNQMFGTACSVRYEPDGAHTNNMFYRCYSLRNIPDLTNLSGRNLYVELFRSATSLDEATNLPVPINSPGFYHTFDHCYRLQDITFAVNADGTPKTANWSGVDIDLTSYIGWAYSSAYITNYNSGVYYEVRNNANYWNYKDTNNWYTANKAFSRYNKTSAINTINSLPDCSAYIASTGGSANTIIFMTGVGSATDGGAIDTMTEEEIAVAASKGWTIAFKDYASNGYI